MYRDPSEFRERFKAYKDGKSVREIYGLPGYEPGKLPVEEMMPYILAVENPTKQGLVNGVWRPPTDSTKWDVHAIGGGLDIREQHNPIVYNYLKTNGRLANPFLTAREEEVLREKVFKKTMLPALQNVYNKYGDKISSKGYARLAGMKWQGHPFLMAISPDSVTGKAFIKAIESGDKDLDSVFDAYYKYPANAKRYAARIQADTNYWKNHNTVTTKPVPQEPIIARQDATRVAQMPTAEQKVINYADHRNTFMAEAERQLEVKRDMQAINDMIFGQQPIYKSTYDIPIIELDQAEFKTTGHKDGKLPGYQLGKAKAIQQGRKQIPIDKAEAATEPDYNEGWFLTTIKRGVNNAIKTVKDQVRAARNIINGRGTLGDYIEVGIDALTGAAGKLLSGSAKEAKQVARRTLKPTKASTKFKTNNPNEVGNYYRKHPEEVTPIVNSPELQNAIKFTEEYTAPRYAKMNKVQIGIDPASIKLGSADFSGTNLGAITGPDGEIILNNSVLGNSQLMEDILAHEFGGHWVNQKYPITPQQASMIQYGLPFKQSFLNSHPGFNQTEEGLAVYRSLQNIASRDFGITGKQLDEFMSRPPEAWLRRTLPRLGYGNAIDWKLPDLLPLGQMSRTVPAAGAGIYLAGNEEYKDGKLPGYSNGKIRIKPSKRGTFTAAAKKHGASVREFESRVLKNPEKYSKAMVKKARFSRNARSWKH